DAGDGCGQRWKADAGGVSGCGQPLVCALGHGQEQHAGHRGAGPGADAASPTAGLRGRSGRPTRHGAGGRSRRSRRSEAGGTLRPAAPVSSSYQQRPSTPSSARRAERTAWSYELKFLVPDPIADQVVGWARAHLAPDPNVDPALGDRYRINSLYFDTPSLDVFYQVGAYARRKYRVRRYGAEPRLFLERKLKAPGRGVEMRHPV